MSIRIDGTNTTANPGITGSDTDTGLQFGTNEVKVVTGGTEQATFDDSGNLVLDGGSDVRIELGSNGTTETNDRNHIRGDGDNVKFNTCADGLLIFEQNGTEELRIQSGGGISFNGDTAAANALDDYEVGTFTGRFNNQDDDATVSHNNQTGFYVKVGDLVHFSLYFDDIDVSSTGSINTAHIFGLPFTSLSTNFHYSVVSIIHNTIITGCAGGYVNTNSTTIIPVDEDSSSTSTFSTGTNFRLMVGGTYRAA